METFSAWLAICAGNSPVTGDFSAQRPVTRSFDVFCVWINGLVNNCEAGDLRRYRAHYDVIVIEWYLLHGYVHIIIIFIHTPGKHDHLQETKHPTSRWMFPVFRAQLQCSSAYVIIVWLWDTFKPDVIILIFVLQYRDPQDMSAFLICFVWYLSRLAMFSATLSSGLLHCNVFPYCLIPYRE